MSEKSYLSEQLRRRNSGEFGYGDFGSAVADYVIDNQEDKSWTDQQLLNAKIKWREMVLAIDNAMRARNDVIASIEAMPAGDDKTLAIREFTDADSIFIQAYNQAQPLFQQIGSLTGDSFPGVKQTNFGIAPAVWALAAGVLVAIGYIATAMYESKKKYEAIMANPKVAPYVSSGGFLQSLGDGIGGGLKWAVIGIAGVFVLSQVMKSRRV